MEKEQRFLRSSTVWFRWACTRCNFRFLGFCYCSPCTSRLDSECPQNCCWIFFFVPICVNSRDCCMSNKIPKVRQFLKYSNKNCLATSLYYEHYLKLMSCICIRTALLHTGQMHECASAQAFIIKWTAIVYSQTVSLKIGVWRRVGVSEMLMLTTVMFWTVTLPFSVGCVRETRGCILNVLDFFFFSKMITAKAQIT